MWVFDDYKTLNQALPCSPVLVAAMLGGGRLQSSTSVGPLWLLSMELHNSFMELHNSNYEVMMDLREQLWNSMINAP